MILQVLADVRRINETLKTDRFELVSRSDA